MLLSRSIRIGKSICVQALFLAWILQGVSFAQISNAAAPDTDAAILAPTEIHRKLNADILEHLSRRHYLKIDIDDTLSSRVLYRYLDDLDPSHSYFYAKDIEEFEKKYKLKLDDSCRKNNLEPAFEIYNRYQQRLIERLTASIKRLEQGLGDMDFNVEESLKVDRKDQQWPDSEDAMEDLWRKRLKSDIITMKLADEPLEEIREKLLKRYKNQLNRVSQNNADDVYQFYINSLAQSIDPHTQYFSPHRTENFNNSFLGRLLFKFNLIPDYADLLRLMLISCIHRYNLHAQGADGEMVDVLGWRLDEVVNMIRGPKGSLVRLQIIPVDTADEHQTKEISIVRDKVKLEEQSAQKRIIEVQFSGITGNIKWVSLISRLFMLISKG
jgi:carboxyl-terminal processing protease